MLLKADNHQPLLSINTGIFKFVTAYSIKLYSLTLFIIINNIFAIFFNKRSLEVIK